jgi:hypothetical protein
MIAKRERLSQHAAISGSSSKKGEEYEDEDEDVSDDEDEYKPESRPTISKRHQNIYIECGRHNDDWLFGGITNAVKAILKKK